MEQFGGSGGITLIALSVLVGVVATAATVRARRHGTFPSEWTIWMPVTVFLLASAPAIPALIADGEVPEPVPAWLGEDSTAVVGGTIAAIMLVFAVACWIIRATAPDEENDESDPTVGSRSS